MPPLTASAQTAATTGPTMLDLHQIILAVCVSLLLSTQQSAWYIVGMRQTKSYVYWLTKPLFPPYALAGSQGQGSFREVLAHICMLPLWFCGGIVLHINLWQVLVCAVVQHTSIGVHFLKVGVLKFQGGWPKGNHNFSFCEELNYLNLGLKEVPLCQEGRGWVGPPLNGLLYFDFRSAKAERGLVHGHHL